MCPDCACQALLGRREHEAHSLSWHPPLQMCGSASKGRSIPRKELESMEANMGQEEKESGLRDTLKNG